MMAALGPGQLNDLLLAYYKANGATSSNITDAEYEFLIAQGASPRNVQDMWEEYLESEGWSGSVDDMKNSYWVKLGGGTVLGPNLWADDAATASAGWTDNGDGTWTCDGTSGDVYIETVADPGNTLQFDVEIIAYTSGALTAKNQGTASASLDTSPGRVKVNVLDTAGFTHTGLASTIFIGTVRLHSVREVL
jgi:hypothetical protein